MCAARRGAGNRRERRGGASGRGLCNGCDRPIRLLVERRGKNEMCARVWDGRSRDESGVRGGGGGREKGFETARNLGGIWAGFLSLFMTFQDSLSYSERTLSRSSPSSSSLLRFRSSRVAAAAKRPSSVPSIFRGRCGRCLIGRSSCSEHYLNNAPREMITIQAFYNVFRKKKEIFSDQEKSRIKS